MIGAKQRPAFHQPDFFRKFFLFLKKPSRKSRAGFTLIELLVVAAVFSLIFLIGTTVFSSVQRYQRGILARQRVVADGRYILETIARSVRLGSINYAYYYDNTNNIGDELNGPGVPTPVLVTKNQVNAVTCYYQENNNFYVQTDGTCTNGTVLNPNDLQVTSFTVYISPLSNPYAPPPTSAGDCPLGSFSSALGVCQCTSNSNCFHDQQCVTAGSGKICQPATIQPQATIVMKTNSTNTGPGEQANITLQTTVVSRSYGR